MGQWTVRMLVDLQGRMDVDAEYQRGLVWSDAQQTLLVDSLLRGFDVPKIYLRRNPPGGKFLLQVVDGKQRLTALWRYFGDELALPKDTEVDGLGQLGRKRFSELPIEAQDVLQFRIISVTEIHEATEAEIAEQFLRLQRGEPLNAAEKRRAIAGPTRTLVRQLQKDHADLFTYLGIPNRRFVWDELCAIVIRLVQAHGPTNLKGADLTDLYEQSDIDPDGDGVEARVRQVFVGLQQVAAQGVGQIRTRWAFVDLANAFILRGERLDELGPQEVMERFLRFEEERRSTGAVLSDFMAAGGEEDEALRDLGIHADMFRYVQAFTREGARKDNVQTRADVLGARLADRG